METNTLSKQVLTVLWHIALRYSGSPKLKRVAYVCLGGEVKYTHDEGYSSMTSAFTGRPKGCKFCVFDTGDGAILVDMFNLHHVTRDTFSDGDNTKQFDNVAAAVMYAVMTE